MGGYEEENFKVKMHAAMICCCCCILGTAMGVFVIFLYPNNILCVYTDNKYLCNEEVSVVCSDCNTTNFTGGNITEYECHGWKYHRYEISQI